MKIPVIITRLAHLIDKMVVSNFLIIGVAILLVVSSIVMSRSLNDWTWFQRSGSLITLLGVMLTYRRMVRMGPRNEHESALVIDGGDFIENQGRESEFHEGLKDTSAKVARATEYPVIMRGLKDLRRG